MTIKPSQNLRQLVAEEAARLIYDEGFRDYRLAKQKATLRLGASNKSHQQPSNDEIHQALIHYIDLYEGEEQANLLKQHRLIALEAMEFLKDFQPRLTGAAQDGTSGPLSAVTIHIRANAPEEVIIFLDENHIPFQEQEKKLSMGKQTFMCPVLRFYADDIEVEVVILPDDMHFATKPISTITGRATEYWNYKQVLEKLN